MDAIIRAAIVAAEPRQLRHPPSRGAAGTGAAKPASGPPFPASAAVRLPQAQLPAPVPSAPLPLDAIVSRASEPAAELAGPASLSEQLAAQRRQIQSLQAELDQLKSIQAQRHAEQLQARQDAANVLVDAERRGLALGQEKGKVEVKAQMLEQVERIASVARELLGVRRQMLEAAEDTLVEIVYTALCKMLGSSVATRAATAAMVHHYVKQVQEPESVCVRLHPHDLALLQEENDGVWYGMQAGLKLQVDAEVNLGGCLLERAQGTLDARLDTQLSRLRDSLLAVRGARAAVRDLS